MLNLILLLRVHITYVTALEKTEYLLHFNFFGVVFTSSVLKKLKLGLVWQAYYVYNFEMKQNTIFDITEMVRELKGLLGWCDDDYGVSKFFNEEIRVQI